MASISKCTACLDSEGAELIPTPCGEHWSCIDCLRRAVQLAINDERHYPIACGEIECGKLSNTLVTDALSTGREGDQALIDRFGKKTEEYGTLPICRMYCANEQCIAANGESRFMSPYNTVDGTNIVCPDCGSSTCRRCRGFVDPSLEHTCNSAEHDAEVVKYIMSLPESERWLWQKCWACAGWVEKSEACNHMECMCSAEFCLICGREWPLGLSNCSHGCPHHEEPQYDEDGYNQNGFHRETGLDREGRTYPAWYDDNYNEDDEDDESVYDENGFDRWGLDVNGYDADGYDAQGSNRQGVDREGFHMDGYDSEGYDRQGFDRRSRDREGYFDDGCDMVGFDRQGISLQNLPQASYDLEGYDPFGFDVFGYTRAGFDFVGRDPEGFDIEGFDAAGYGRDGYDPGGFDRNGLNHLRQDHEGYSRRGYNAHHRDRLGALQPGYCIGPDGNVQERPNEGPSAEIMECEHQTHFFRGSATCYVCDWTSDIFFHECRLCDAALCRDCDNSGVERQRRIVRNNYPWPGADSYGIEKMFEMI